MFIELTDQLRCPSDHEEAFLVLLPDQVLERSVRSGELGCPVCGRTFQLQDGVLDVGGGEPPGGVDPTTELAPPALTALVGLSGPGGYLVVVGAPGSGWREIRELNPGVGLIAVNPPADVLDAGLLSVVRGGMLPLRTRTMRGAVLGRGFGSNRRWVEEASRVVLPGLHIVGEGPLAFSSPIELLASTGNVWVGTPRR